LKTIEDVRAGIVKVDREMDELTIALKNPEHLGRSRGYLVVPWKFAFRETLPPIKAVEEEGSGKRRNDSKR
jgi:hypothetical protein